MNILIIKVGALGDVLRTSFIAQALKEKYISQKPKIFWMTDKKAKPFFLNNLYVDHLVVLEAKNKLKGINFDLVINLEEDIENCKFAESLKPKKLIGFYYSNEKVLPTQTTKEWYDMSALGKKPQNNILKKQNKKTHRQIISEIVEIKNHEKYEPFLRLTSQQREHAQNFLRWHNLSRNDLIIGINTGSADRWPKQLSIKKTATLIDRLYKELGAKILLFGGPNEIERNKEILGLSKSPIIITGCGNDLVEFPALISVCNLFITSDSLGLHIALALKRKTIALLGPTSASEIDMYGLGEKVIAKSKCICCYSPDCKSMEKIDLNEIFLSLKELLKQKITILITSFKDPAVAKAIESALNQKTRYEYNVIVSAPDKETQLIVNKYVKKDKRVKFLKDPGKGKSFAINWTLSQIDTDILILTDGDVYFGDKVVEEVGNLFLDPEIGCVSGRPVPMEDRKTKYGYWANFLFEAAHKIRKQNFEKHAFIECSGYLFAFRKDKIKKFPLDVSEDAVIPYMFWQKGYRIGYAENALVYVKNARNLNDWIKQKTRTHKAHEKLDLYVDTKTTPKVKSFKTEAKGINWLISYPKNFKEIIWTIQLVFARTYTWANYFIDTKIIAKHYQDAWERVESTK